MRGSILGGADVLEMEDGRQLRLLSAMEVLEARREGQELACGEREQALCSNACLLARALIWDGENLFRDGGDVLEQLTVEEIGTLAKRWAQFNARVNPGPGADGVRVEELKNVWSTHRKRGCTGACCEHSQPCPQKRACAG